MKYKIYKITNTKNEKVYIGVTERSLSERFTQHLSSSRRDFNYKLPNAIRKYGEESFEITLLKSVSSREEMMKEEVNFIKEYDSYYNGYNSTLGGEGTPTVDIPDEEIIKSYHELKSSIKVSNLYQIGENTVLRVLKDNNIALYGSGYESTLRVPSQEVVNSYRKTRSQSKTAKELGISTETVSRKLKESCEELFDFGYSKEEELEFISKYKNSTKSLTEISEDLKVNRKTLSRILKKYDVEIENRGRHRVSIVAFIDGEELEFETVVSCAKYLIELGIPKSNKVKTVNEGINRSIRVGVPYYGITFIKP